MTLVQENDDINSGVVQQSSVTFEAVGGTLYRIAVDGYNDGSGTAQGSIQVHLFQP